MIESVRSLRPARVIMGMIDRHATNGRAVSAHNYSNPRLQHAMAESRRRVYNAFRQLQPCTVNEVIQHLQQQGLNDDLDGKSTSSRVTEMVADGLLKVVASITDPVSGYQARQMVAVDPADAIPLPKNLSKRELQDQVADLQRKLDREVKRTEQAINIAATALAEWKLLKEGRV